LSGFEIGSVSNGPAVVHVHPLKVTSETEEAHGQRRIPLRVCFRRKLEIGTELLALG
jgi:hypothetical protein